MEIVGIVDHGVVKLPEDARLPEGARVVVVWQPAPGEPYEREPLQRDDVEADLAWATNLPRR